RPAQTSGLGFRPIQPIPPNRAPIFLEHVNSKKARASNINCVVTTDVRHDGSEPVVDIMFADGDRLIMKGANLTAAEMLSAFNSRCIAKDLKAEEKTKKKGA
uniref:Large ribosomal subunit protein mL53 n=1 Tax=Chelonoidis abingdonii TaxID=106734 RepID=A0A8C0HB87_CHEAB